MTRVIQLTGVAAILTIAVSACSNPQPRGYAQTGVAPGNDRALNSTYYTGADPDFQRQGKSRGGP